MAASDLEKGKFFIYKGEVLQVMRKSLVNVGTHSHTKLVITASDLNGKKIRELVMGHNDRVEMIEVMKKKGTVLSIIGEKLQIMDSHSYETLDASCDKDLFSTLHEGDEITYVDYKEVRILGKTRQN
jgi:translation initiation factor 5A